MNRTRSNQPPHEHDRRYRQRVERLVQDDGGKRPYANQPQGRLVMRVNRHAGRQGHAVDQRVEHQTGKQSHPGQAVRPASIASTPGPVDTGTGVAGAMNMLVRAAQLLATLRIWLQGFLVRLVTVDMKKPDREEHGQ